MARLFVWLQWILPKHLLTTIVYHVTRIENTAIKNVCIRRFAEHFDVNVDEAAHPVPDGYRSFNEFFTRPLADGARPIDTAADSIVSPVDGTVSAAGRIDSDLLLQAKGLQYTLNDLLMTDIEQAERFTGGSFATLYLAPNNYHRVHSPLRAELLAARYVPGALYSVNTSTVRYLANLFTRNERLILQMTTDYGPMAVIFVGALNVGSMSTPWTGTVRPRRRGVVDALDIATSGKARAIDKGDLLGWFNMGSTVIVLLPAGACEWSPQMMSGEAVTLGQPIGRMMRESS